MPTDKESYKLSGKKRTRVERRKANVTTRIKKNVEMVKNTQKGNIDEKTGLVKSGKNKNRQRTLKRQKSKLDRINTRLDKKVASKPTTTPKVSKKKVKKLDNRLGRLKDKKVYKKRRERKIAKLSQKAAGVNKSTIRANKMVDKYLDDPNIKLSKRKRAKVKRHVDSGNVDIMAKVNSIQARTKTSTTPKATNTKLTRKQKVTKRMTGSAMKAAYMGKLGKASKILGRLKFRKGVQVTTTHPDNQPTHILRDVKPKKVKRAKYYK